MFYGGKTLLPNIHVSTLHPSRAHCTQSAPETLSARKRAAIIVRSTVLRRPRTDIPRHSDSRLLRRSAVTLQQTAGVLGKGLSGRVGMV